jgi:hypothetical protein
MNKNTPEHTTNKPTRNQKYVTAEIKFNKIYKIPTQILGHLLIKLIF